ncbi:MAG: methyltransferase domain-containing protein [Pseudomonadota bacterium]
MPFDEIRRVERACPSCGSHDQTALPAYSRGDWKTVKCDACGFVYLNEAPVYEELSENLAWTQQFAKEQKRRKVKQPVVAWLDEKTRWRLHMLRDDEWRYICDHVSSGRVLDVGCGARSRVPEEFEPYGIEIERAAAEACAKDVEARGGRVIHAPALEGLKQFESDFFDGMIMRSFLEHEAQPRDVLAEAYRTLRPGGALYVKVPNFATINRVVRGVEWCGFRFPDHLNYFTVSSLTRLAHEAGFQVKLKNWATRLTNDNMHVFLVKP